MIFFLFLIFCFIYFMHYLLFEFFMIITMFTGKLVYFILLSIARQFSKYSTEKLDLKLFVSYIIVPVATFGVMFTIPYIRGVSLHCFAASSALSNKFPRTATRSLSFINSILKPVSTKNSILTCSFNVLSLKSVKIEPADR